LDFLRITERHLTRKGFENPRLESELLLGHVLRLDRVGLYLQYDRPLLPEEIGKFRSALRHRLNHEPLQWILGVTEFYGIRLLMKSGVFIPRPETELLVEIANRYIKEVFERRDPNSSPLQVAGGKKRGISFNVLDIGTGSGSIALAIASANPEVMVNGCDVSSSALELARENAKQLSLANRVTFDRWDMMDYRIPEFFEVPYQWITMNPPYVRSGDWDSLPPEVKAEPRGSLDGGDDGLRFYRRLVELLPDILVKSGGVSMEIGIGQADAVSGLFKPLFQKIACTPDYNGIDRVVCGIEYRGDEI
jgi:release factor glutamine methyltransferase